MDEFWFPSRTVELPTQECLGLLASVPVAAWRTATTADRWLFQ
jgi:hypothetical protein